MRVIVEIDERSGTGASVQTTRMEQAAAEILDGGSPSAMLQEQVGSTMPSMSESLPSRIGMNAGPPPEWLVSAIAAAPSQTMSSDNGNGQHKDMPLDAGSAPAM